MVVVMLVVAMFFCAAPAAMARATDVQTGACVSGSDSGACKPTPARTLLQHVAAGTAAVIAADVAAVPDGIVQYSKDYIIMTLVPQAEATTRELQAGLDESLQGFQACSSAQASEESSLTSQESTLITAEQRHNECEMKVAQMNRTEGTICGDLKEFAETIDAPKDAREVNGSSPEACLATLGAMNEFYNNVYPQFLEKKKACELSQNGEEVTAEQCAADKTSIEGSWCGLHSARVQACANLKSCLATKSKHFDEVAEMTKNIEDNTKKHVQKYLDACNAKKDCQPGAVDLSTLALHYPVKPQSVECDAETKTDWDYSHVDCSGEETLAVVEPTPPPTPAVTSGATQEQTSEATPAEAGAEETTLAQKR